jgi:hypothetical protein
MTVMRRADEAIRAKNLDGAIALIEPLLAPYPGNVGGPDRRAQDLKDRSGIHSVLASVHCLRKDVDAALRHFAAMLEDGPHHACGFISLDDNKAFDLIRAKKGYKDATGVVVVSARSPW